MSSHEAGPGGCRRHFLRGLAGCLALPVLESLAGQSLAGQSFAGPPLAGPPLAGPPLAGPPFAGPQVAALAKARRVVFVAPDYGMHHAGFFPQKAGTGYVMPRLLKSLEPYRGSLSIFSGLDHPGVGGGHACSATFLNGIKVSDADGDRRKLLSVDQLIAERVGAGTRVPSLRTGSGAPVS